MAVERDYLLLNALARAVDEPAAAVKLTDGMINFSINLITQAAMAPAQRHPLSYFLSGLSGLSLTAMY